MSLDNDWPFGVMCADCETVLDPSSDDLARRPWALLKTEERAHSWVDMLEADIPLIFRVVCLSCWRKEVES